MRPARGPPLWDDCDAQIDKAAHIEPACDPAIGQCLPLRQGPPALGAHAEELLRTLSYADSAIADLHAAGVIGVAGY